MMGSPTLVLDGDPEFLLLVADELARSRVQPHQVSMTEAAPGGCPALAHGPCGTLFRK